MTHFTWIFGYLTIVGAVMRAFCEHLVLKLCRVPVEDRSYLQHNELFGHVEHKPVRTFGKGFCVCFIPGLTVCLIGTAFALPAALQLVLMGVKPHSIVTGERSVMFYLCVAMMVLALSLFCHAFPTYEDALYLWESRKTTNIVVRILLFVPLLCMRAGAFLARFGVWQLVAIAAVAAWIIWM
jgi:hypothetical protein